MAAIALGPAPACAASPCERLATAAGGLVPSAWADGSKALRPFLEIHVAADPKTAFEVRLAQDPVVRKAAGDLSGNWGVLLDRLPGSDLYAASTFQGTLNCQTTAFVLARPGRPTRLVKGPPGADDELCWTRSGAFGRVFGAPAYFEHGANDQTTEDEDLRIVPWVDGRWGAGCTLKLRYAPLFVVAERHCRDPGLCKDLERELPAIATAYHRYRQVVRDNTPFSYNDGAMSEAFKQAVAAARPDDFSSPDWPGFGDKPDRRSMSYSGLSYFPLTIAKRAYVAAIAHEGVGWRERPTALLIVYSSENGTLAPQASYAIDRKIGGLASASAD
jgi:hypothetical protein